MVERGGETLASKEGNLIKKGGVVVAVLGIFNPALFIVGGLGIATGSLIENHNKKRR